MSEALDALDAHIEAILSRVDALSVEDRDRVRMAFDHWRNAEVPAPAFHRHPIAKREAENLIATLGDAVTQLSSTEADGLIKKVDNRLTFT